MSPKEVTIAMNVSKILISGHLWFSEMFAFFFSSFDFLRRVLSISSCSMCSPLKAECEIKIKLQTFLSSNGYFSHFHHSCLLSLCPYLLTIKTRQQQTHSLKLHNEEYMNRQLFPLNFPQLFRLWEKPYCFSESAGEIFALVLDALSSLAWLSPFFNGKPN